MIKVNKLARRDIRSDWLSTNCSSSDSMHVGRRLFGTISVPLLPQVFSDYIDIQGNMTLGAHPSDWRREMKGKLTK